MEPLLESLRIVIYRQDEWWIAQCLERDVTAAGKNLEDLHYELERVLVGHCVIAAETGSEPFVGLGPAPPRFFSLWERAATTADPVQPLQFPTPLGITPPSLTRRLVA